MKQLKRWNDAFLEVPAVKKPQGVWATTSGFMLMNNNAVHFAYLGGGGGGHFGYAYPNDDMQLNSMVTAGSSSCLSCRRICRVLCAETLSDKKCD